MKKYKLKILKNKKITLMIYPEYLYSSFLNYTFIVNLKKLSPY